MYNLPNYIILTGKIKFIFYFLFVSCDKALPDLCTILVHAPVGAISRMYDIHSLYRKSSVAYR